MAHRDALSPEELAEAESLVADEATLWSEFLHEVRRLGTITRTSPDGFVFVATDESAERTFLITPARLREVLVIDQAHYLHLGDHPAFCDRLPQWLLDDLFETIGANEEPLDEPVVTIDDGGELRLSARRAQPEHRFTGRPQRASRRSRLTVYLIAPKPTLRTVPSLMST